jgi:threonyl-tRNA synthetase
MMKIPYLLIVGQQELDNKSVNVREFKTKEQYEQSTREFGQKLVIEYKERML